MPRDVVWLKFLMGPILYLGSTSYSRWMTDSASITGVYAGVESRTPSPWMDIYMARIMEPPEGFIAASI